jgi:hypothetical protein
MTGEGRKRCDRIGVLGVLLASSTALVALAPRGAEASTVTLDGSGQMSFSFQFLWSDPSTPSLGNDYVLGVPGQYTFLDQFLTQQPSSPNLATSTVGPYDFQDSYRFTIGKGAGGDVLTASLTSGSAFDISNLQFRLYSVPSSTTAPVVGGLPGGATLVQSWIGAPAGSNSIVATFAGIQTGTYILDIAGIASGTSGGTYVGQLDLVSAVPVPAAVWLFGSALALAGTRLRRLPASAAAVN